MGRNEGCNFCFYDCNSKGPNLSTFLNLFGSLIFKVLFFIFILPVTPLHYMIELGGQGLFNLAMAMFKILVGATCMSILVFISVLMNATWFLFGWIYNIISLIMIAFMAMILPEQPIPLLHKQMKRMSAVSNLIIPVPSNKMILSTYMFNQAFVGFLIKQGANFDRGFFSCIMKMRYNLAYLLRSFLKVILPGVQEVMKYLVSLIIWVLKIYIDIHSIIYSGVISVLGSYFSLVNQSTSKLTSLVMYCGLFQFVFSASTSTVPCYHHHSHLNF